eukprot:CAMPEP_0206223076 /NCGR_PEP_ID=MMETSP0047_2-20121206/6296_1 /ASSEMBLY_ACC=CAM_ASM_000192 /TAXON_ID=195065 /ORGANISM="Chroomonas mesostigmatica_cf, Strain CCMP1168" /LENGTH=66 /DNA_ID=CAMNT_0053645935 /DNA_START=72 /DNA_END=268 /DNA_ORIENTATION=+
MSSSPITSVHSVIKCSLWSSFPHSRPARAQLHVGPTSSGLSPGSKNRHSPHSSHSTQSTGDATSCP